MSEKKEKKVIGSKKESKLPSEYKPIKKINISRKNEKYFRDFEEKE